MHYIFHNFKIIIFAYGRNLF